MEMKVKIIVSVERVHSIFFDMKIETASLSETSIAIYYTTHFIPEGSSLQ
jgi:hypothetical protein